MAAPFFDTAFQQVQRLVSNFQQNEPYYLSPSFSEADVRKDFIDKFWIAIGWDVNHEVQTNPYEQEVKVERGVGSGRRQRADYAFLAPNYRDVLFYVEAKKPSVDLESREHYFQTVRYGWNSHTPLAVLTDFEQFHVLDCRLKPDPDTVLHRAIKKYRYIDYADEGKFREIYHLFSREAALTGAIRRFADTLKLPAAKPRQRSLFPSGVYQTVDESFLQRLDEFREALARAFKRLNPELDGDGLTEATQRTLDRLVFLRFLEDKLIEADAIVEKFLFSSSPWRDFVVICRRLDRIYNGTIFKAHSIVDDPGLRMDDGLFVDICAGLSHEDSPYDFNAIPIHILGSIYERFLGKTIVVSEKQARVEEKPEVRKAGGVYYTPEYIVRHIVEHTVGASLAGKTPAEIRSMRFADISCGSGSFLLEVYDLLLRYHTTYYNRSNRTRAEGLRAGCRVQDDGTLRLSILQRREILLNNIFGVDIDPQAVEVAQLSLYLKLLEDETITSARAYQMELREALLPSLSSSIVCGNSLVGPDLLDDLLFDLEREKRVNALSFEAAFPNIFRDGGFDVLVGNPPYVRAERLDREQLTYFKKRYFVEGQTDLYLLFIERGLELLKDGGYFGCITPKFLFFNLDAESTRKKILCNRILRLTDVGQAFKGVNTECAITVLRKERGESGRISAEIMAPGGEITWRNEMEQASFAALPNSILNIYLTDRDLRVIRKVLRHSVRLGDIVAIKRGMEVGKKAVRESSGTIKTLLGEDVGRYSLQFQGTFLNKGLEEVSRLRDHSTVAEKLLIRRVAADLTATLDQQGYFYTKNLYGVVSKTDLSLKYLLALLNSRLMRYFFRKYFTTKKTDIFPEFQKYQLDGLPIRLPDLSAAADQTRHDRLIQLVDQALITTESLCSAKTDRDQTFFQKRCQMVDREIDRLVYEIYDLRDNDVAFIEEQPQ